MRRRTLIVLVAGSALPVASTAAANTTDMIEPGRQAAGCSQYVDPSESLEAALEELSPGDVLCLRDGTHGPDDTRVDAPDGSARHPITVRAENRHQATVVGHTEIVDADYWNVEGLRFTNPDEVGSERIVVLIGGTGWVFQDNEIFDGAYAGLLVGKSTEHGAAHDYAIRGNYIHDVGSSNLYHNPGPDSTGGVIERNIFAYADGNGSNTKLGWGGDDGCDGSNADVFGIGEVTYRFNTLHGGSDHPLIVAERGGELPIRVYGNLITGSRSSHSVRIDNVEGCLGDDVEVSHNAWYGSARFAWDAGDQSAVMERMDENLEVDPDYNKTSGRDGFVPGEPEARNYGHLAPRHQLPPDAPRGLGLDGGTGSP